MRLAVSALGWLLARAEHLELIPRNPARGTDHYQAEKRTRTVYSETEIEQLFPGNVWETNDYRPWKGPEDYTAFLLALCTGMRRSEVLALRWEDVHLEDDPYVSVAWQQPAGEDRRRPRSRKPRVTPIFDFVFSKDRRAVWALQELSKRAAT